MSACVFMCVCISFHILQIAGREKHVICQVKKCERARQTRHLLREKVQESKRHRASERERERERERKREKEKENESEKESSREREKQSKKERERKRERERERERGRGRARETERARKKERDHSKVGRSWHGEKAIKIRVEKAFNTTTPYISSNTPPPTHHPIILHQKRWLAFF